VKHFPLLTLTLLGLTAIPLALWMFFSAHVLNQSIKSSIVNDPQSALTQSLNSLTGNVHLAYNQILLKTLPLATGEDLKKALGQDHSPETYKTLAEGALKENSLDLLVLVNGEGLDLYDNLEIPQPVVSAPMPLMKMPHRPKTSLKNPLPLPSLKDWPGLSLALSGIRTEGILNYKETSYLAVQIPVEKQGKIVGVVIGGKKIDFSFLYELKSAAVNDVGLYSQSQTWCTRGLPPPDLNYTQAMVPGTVLGLENHSLTWGGSPFLVSGIPLNGIDQKPAAFLADFQTVIQNQTVEGKPSQTILQFGLLLLLAALALAGALSWIYQTSFRKLTESVREIGQGNLKATFHKDPLTEWGRLGEELSEMVIHLQEKERVSLILGKVVAPEAARKILAEKDYFSLKGEKRECTLLQADLMGFNSLSENMSPESLVESLNQYFSLMNDFVFKYEGMLDKFIGDRVIALWGAPFRHEDKEIRAVKAALEIQEALKGFNISRIQKGLPPFTVGIGIHTGWVVSGNLGSDKHYDYSIIGEALHVVSRLCAMSAPGQVVVSSETFDKVQTFVKGNPLNPIVVKGSPYPLMTYEVTPLP
jgi:class 3 adenylate cyclase